MKWFCNYSCSNLSKWGAILPPPPQRPPQFLQLRLTSRVIWYFLRCFIFSFNQLSIMRLLKSISLGALIVYFAMVGSVLALAVEPLFSTAWSQLNPNSMESRIKEISKDVKEIKTHLHKIEVAIIFGQGTIHILRQHL